MLLSPSVLGHLPLPEIAGQSAVLNFEQQKELLKLRIQLETEKELAVERMRQGIELERAVSLEKLRQEIEQAKLELQREKLSKRDPGEVRG
ncbi:hypothetical protein NQZ68_025940 [Dissostichus eleginoides]|nr:hypothetical protein NQZ68_025940 [Dissostichus eleginoides]